MSAASLVADNISWAPHRSLPRLLHPVSFELQSGQVLGVVGPNGAGKSTLLRMIYHYQQPTSGRILVDGEDIWSLPPKAAARKVAAVLQEQPGAFGLTVRDIVTLGRTPHRLGFSTPGAQDAEIVDAAIVRMDLQHLMHRDLGTLSGGERQRVMVARALAQQPQVLVMDEPTNHLDIRHQLEILSLSRTLGLTIVVSLHDLNMAADVCDAVLLLEDGHCKGFGPPEDVLSELQVSQTFRVTAHRETLSLSNTQHLSFHLPS
ncbi:ABC transporter ATP-binding protein [Aliiroseovarius crassostreae]|uniref:ABC transporter ATP-binding protein n=1 Tax=Aliiroseovarius crassostreae TaxID=154981 RepID=UPI0021FDE4C2|nr:ABC transporter ATP-binding protein [Aliiroseovarius crassostreae]UWP89215.1 ABC transporter ATP-binding protein [Aliiroseovarius crassostreae]